MKRLFEPLELKKLKLKNRIVMPPMCMYSAEEGLANAFHETHYTTRAMGGTGLIIVEATGVLPQGRISDHCLGLWNDAQGEALSRVVERVHAAGAKIGIQLIHAGRKSTVTGRPLQAPSAVRFSEDFPVPEEMSKTEIEEVVEAYRSAALRALNAGFDLVEIHAAHGYLINQFLSPLVNYRSDAYGENQFLLLTEVVQSVRSVWPVEMPLSVRISAEEYDKGGLHPEDLASGILGANLQALGVDLLHVSSGGVVSAPVRDFPGYQLEFARVIGTTTGIPTITGGRMTDPVHVEDVLALPGIDLVFLGRELLRNPYWPLAAAQRLGVEIEWPKQYERARYK
ncbi:oxidoreductase [Acidaminobacter hydrogenoformans]|uniref:NADPH2 dehydrogenase n=1 Tax=Acidaminobacter hydrogenoformans DSM 2784 TaxID=1120920 RepID=A0A1G5S7K9_9FIRM|nr:NADPH dehydrogenase [Acidaminobacter hydrogenoformans]SCZ81701.1 NADPH2 dehydrogenase [Acidaminobacter hydrogenoformans DSM 2784]